MDISFLPEKFVKALNRYNYNLLYEIRFRISYPVKINYFGDKKFLIDENGEKLVCAKNDLLKILDNLTENSFYAFNDKIKKGYITTSKGVRVGLAGECVCEDGKIITIKNLTSLCVRIPHSIFGASDSIYEKLYKTEIYNTLIVSPPFMGKTTILKDLIRRFNVEKSIDILVIDERGEFSNITGENVDVISYADKSAIFSMGIRTMSPNVIIMDELGSGDDFSLIEYAVSCGIKIIATMHGEKVNDLYIKKGFNYKVFDRFVFLKNSNKKGVVDKVLDGEFNEI